LLSSINGVGATIPAGGWAQALHDPKNRLAASSEILANPIDDMFGKYL